MALKLSIQDKPEPAGPLSKNSNAVELPGQPSTVPVQQAPSQPVPSGTTAATVSRVRALFDFQPSEPGELQFRRGDVIAVLESVYKDWWKGSLRGQTGIFPLNYVEKLSDPTQGELQKEAQMEAEVFGEIKNVEKLLALLSTSSGETNVRDNEEITGLYHQTLAIRPKLIELIGKYTQKKGEPGPTDRGEWLIPCRRLPAIEREVHKSQKGLRGTSRTVNGTTPASALWTAASTTIWVRGRTTSSGASSTEILQSTAGCDTILQRIRRLSFS